MKFRMLSIACLVSLGVGVTQAAVIPFDINPDLPVQPGGVIPGGNLIGSLFTYYNIQYDIDGGGVDLNIRTAVPGSGGPTVNQVVSDGLNSASIMTKGANDYINTPFVLGEVIGDGLNETARLPDQFSVINDGGYQLFAEGRNYLGFKLPTGNFGYVKVNYAGATSTYTFLGGAYENSGVGIAAGAVPEPASILLLTMIPICGLGRRTRRF